MLGRKWGYHRALGAARRGHPHHDDPARPSRDRRCDPQRPLGSPAEQRHPRQVGRLVDVSQSGLLNSSGFQLLLHVAPRPVFLVRVVAVRGDQTSHAIDAWCLVRAAWLFQAVDALQVIGYADDAEAAREQVVRLARGAITALVCENYTTGCSVW